MTRIKKRSEEGVEKIGTWELGGAWLPWKFQVETTDQESTFKYSYRFEYLENSSYASFFRKEILCQRIVRKKDVRERSEKEQDVKNDNLILKVYSAHGHAVQRCVFCNENSI